MDLVSFILPVYQYKRATSLFTDGRTVAGGKVEPGETPLEAAKRELEVHFPIYI